MCAVRSQMHASAPVLLLLLLLLCDRQCRAGEGMLDPDLARSMQEDAADCLEVGGDPEEGTSMCVSSLALLQRRGRRLVADEAAVEKPRKPIKGISYGPSPLAEAGQLPRDDFFCGDAKPMWGTHGRGDLEIMKQLGANTVRLYGNDPELDHEEFLDLAHLLGLGVIPGNGDAAFYGESCKQSGNYSCAEGVHKAYGKNLEKGFLTKDRRFHAAIDYVIVVNEPELKFPNLQKPRSFAKAIATAIDGMLDAEDAANIAGPRPNFTATFSFANCPACGQHGHLPGLGQMWQFRNAMLNPSKYGITPTHNLTQVFHDRFTYSFNSGNPAHEIKALFLDKYETIFPATPIFIGEYHNPGNPNTENDLKTMLAIAEQSPLLLGLSFFEWQNRYDEAGHLIWGMFDPQIFASGLRMRLGFREFEIPCLSAVFDSENFKSVPEQITAAFGGAGLQANKLMCQPHPKQVTISKHGFNQMLGLKNSTQMGQFIQRAVDHMGGWAPDGVPELISNVFVNPYAKWESLEAMLEGRPDWAKWEVESACIADKASLKSEVGNTIGYVCGLGFAECDKIPEECKRDVWDTANFVFGSHFKIKSLSEDRPMKPLTDCRFHGLAKFVRPDLYRAFHNNTGACLVPVGNPTPDGVFVSFHGFNKIQEQKNSFAMGAFIERTVSYMGGQVVPGALPKEVADRYKWSNASFSTLESELATHPSWATWSSSAACVPDKKARPSDVGASIGQICSEGVFDCSSIPAACKGNVWNTAAFVFGSHYKISASLAAKKNTTVSPLRDCHMGGKAKFASPTVFAGLGFKESCVVQMST